MWYKNPARESELRTTITYFGDDEENHEKLQTSQLRSADSLTGSTRYNTEGYAHTCTQFMVDISIHRFFVYEISVIKYR
jgi:hypothetical protein